MKMVALPCGKQLEEHIHGPAVNVPSRLDTICSVLPRLPSQTELIPLKLKRKLVYRKHYMYDFISPEKVLNHLVHYDIVYKPIKVTKVVHHCASRCTRGRP